MVVAIEGFEVIAEGCIGCDEDCVADVVLWLAGRCSCPIRTCFSVSGV
jgi:hypothetical protein